MNKQIYMIFYDRGYRAQDNAEHLCRWVMKHHPEIKTKYILNSSSSDWDRLKKEGFNLINGLDKTATHLELLQCDYACSSIFNESINLDFSNCMCKRIFLNHGLFLAPINYIKDEHDKIDLFIATSKIEYDTFLNSFHNLTAHQIALCGQARHDELISKQKEPHIEDSILIQFWQRPGEWHDNNNKRFLMSTFYQKTSALLSNKKLLELCRTHNLKIIFKMHSIQYNWLSYYKKFENDVVRLSPLSEPFEPIFIQSKAIITDISSNAYEMAKIGKPCIYFEPDPKELFSWRQSRNGKVEFDLQNKSIGPVIYENIDTLIAEIETLINNNYKLSQKYLERRKQQISFLNDANNCERCFNAIMKVQTSRAADKKKIAMIRARKADGRSGCYLYF